MENKPLRVIVPVVSNSENLIQSLFPTIFPYLSYTGRLKLANKPGFNLGNMMSKKPVKATLTTAKIEEQTAVFLKSGGSVDYVVKGKSGQFASAGSKQINLKSN
ncbi:hypothetical protein [Marinobacter changyiensis]|uniref:hypothetical protein n=1 Tax=Marinobacter changyiensis TaxID=2604091 RepID=UPI001264F3B4|nr:hypothetical protein [Marinobacter changyiensis]